MTPMVIGQPKKITHSLQKQKFLIYKYGELLMMLDIVMLGGDLIT
jgi:hypothetical protein